MAACPLPIRCCSVQLAGEAEWRYCRSCTEGTLRYDLANRRHPFRPAKDDPRRGDSAEPFVSVDPSLKRL
jgi:hypothetical protein